MAERAGSLATAVSENDPMADFEFKPLAREEYYLDDVFVLYFQLPEPDRCPSYLDVIRIAPYQETSARKFQSDQPELILSYCRWSIESGDGQFSMRVKVRDIVATNSNFSRADEGIVYVAQYIAAPDNKVIAESTPFRIYPVLEESTMNLPEAFSDDGLIVLGSESDSEPELLDEEPEKTSEKNFEKTDRSEDELTIVMTERELREMENENRATNKKLRSFIDQYKKDLLELTKCNETLKQKLYDEQYKITNIEKAQSSMSKELVEIRAAKHRVEAILKETIAERERKLREEQGRAFKLEEEVSLLNGQVENLRCCVDAHLETKNLLMAEMESLRVKREPIEVLDKATSTPSIQEAVRPRQVVESNEDILLLEETRSKLNDEIARLQRVKRKLWRDIVRMKSETVHGIPSEHSTDTSDVGEPFKVSGQQNTDLEDRVQDLTKRLQSAKLEYISLYKENKRKEKALENICNWASLAKDGMSLEAPEPSQVPSLLSLTRNKFTSSFDELLPKMINNSPAPSATNDQVPQAFSGFLSAKPRTSGLESFEDDFVQLGSDSKLPLPPRQKRKYDILRKSSATVAAGIASTAVSRAMQRGKMVVRGRHRAYEPVRFPLKRETPSPGKEVLDYSPSCLLPAAIPSKPAQSARPRTIFKKKELLKPSAPEPTAAEESTQNDEEASENPVAAPPIIPRGTNTYSAAGLISDLETDASNTEEEPSVNNPNICPLCVTSILDYEAHMREAHQKQPCPICGYVFDTNIPLYVMTYHIERHLEDVEETLQTQ